jgi:hypothetical protein
MVRRSRSWRKNPSLCGGIAVVLDWQAFEFATKMKLVAASGVT